MTAPITPSSYLRIFPVRRATPTARNRRRRPCRSEGASAEPIAPRASVPLRAGLIEDLFMETQAIADAPSAEAAVACAMELVQRHVACESAAVLYADRDAMSLRFLAASGPSAEVVSHLRIPLGSGFAGRAVQDGDDFLIQDAERDERHLSRVDVWTGYRTRRLLVSPLCCEEARHPVGCIELLNPDTERFTREDLEVVRLIARPLAAYLATHTVSA